MREPKHDYFTTLKTASSNRHFIIDGFLVGELRRWKLQQKQNELATGAAYVYIFREEDGRVTQLSKGIASGYNAQRVPLVCVHPDGRAVKKPFITKFLALEGLNAHSFRHTHATLLIESGATPKGVAGRLGHATTAITQNLYTHETEKLREDTAEIFEKTMQTKSKCRQMKA